MTEFSGLPLEDPEKLGFSRQRLERIAHTMEEAVRSGHVPCTATVVVRQGKVAHSHCCGVLDLELGGELPMDALFRMYSQTKPMVAAMTMVLFEEGLFLLDEPISKFLPEFSDPTVVVQASLKDQVRGSGLLGPQEVRAQREITIFDLLTMTSGIANQSVSPTELWPLFKASWEGTGFWAEDTQINAPVIGSYEALVLSLAAIPNFAHPGAEWRYGSDFDLLTLLLERASGCPIDELMRTRIFEPLGMKDSTFYCPKDKVARLATDHTWSEQGSLVVHDPAASAEKVHGGDPRLMSGNGLFGGVLSTPADYTRFAQMLLNGGHLDGVQVLGRKTVELMTTNHIGDKEINLGIGPGYGFGFGVQVQKGVGGARIPGSAGAFGWGGAAGTWFFVDPSEDLTALFFTHVFGYQYSPTADLVERFVKQTYEALV